MFTNPIFITGDPEWSDYTVEVSVKPLAVEDGAGVVFRYHTNRHYYWFGLSGGKEAQLAAAPAAGESLPRPAVEDPGLGALRLRRAALLPLKVVNDGPRIRAYVDGRLVLEASDAEILKGKAGLMASGPARFQDFRVSASDDAATSERLPHPRGRPNWSGCAPSNPQPALWKKFRTPGFGAGRNVRFGDLDGDGIPEMLIGQNIMHVSGDFVQLSA